MDNMVVDMKNIESPRRRNVVMIISDSLRYDFLHVYGADFIPTPNIDELADNGVVCDNVITPSTVCGPSRASVLSGINVSAHDSWTNNIEFREGIEFFPERLSKAGYLTVACGCLDHPTPEKPYGFQYVECFRGNRTGCAYRKWLKERHPEITSYAIADPLDPHHFKFQETEHYDRWSCDCATSFIDYYSRNHKIPNNEYRTAVTSPEDNDAPFFLMCGFMMPHSPYLPPHEVAGRVDENRIPPIITTKGNNIADVEKNRRAFMNTPEQLNNEPDTIEKRMKDRKAYCEMVCEVDDLIGRIVASLKANGLYENTTIIFTADHGSVENDYNVVTKGPWPYSSQLFVPMIISNHPGINGRTEFVCSTIDIGATILGIAGDHKRFGISRSIIDQISGRTPFRHTVMSEFCDSCKTIVDERYTFTYYPFSGETALYDRIEDPMFTENLGGRAECKSIENKFLKEIIDNMIISKGVRIEAHDLVKSVKKGIEDKDPNFLDAFDIAYPLASMKEIDRLKNAGLPWDINEFCKNRPIKAHYGVYFIPKEKK